MSSPNATVLVVEDHPDTLEGLTRVLEGEGFATSAARNGREAIEYLSAHSPPKVILLDMLMPDMDGWRFLDEFKAIPFDRTPRIIVVTAVPDISAEWCKAAGCCAFIRKPPATDELLAEVRRCAANGDKAAPQPSIN